MEAGPLAELAVPGLEVLGRLRVADDGIHPGADLLHLLEVGVLEGGQHGLRAHLLPRYGLHLLADAAGQVGPAVLDQVLLGAAARLVLGEVLQPALLPAGGGDGGEPFGIDRGVGADVHRGWRALEDQEFLAGLGEMRDALHRRGAGADDGDPLVAELRERRAQGIAAGVVIVPAAGVEGMALEGLDARYAGQLGHVQRAGA